MNALSMRRGLPFTVNGPSIIFSRRSPVNGSPSCRQALSTFWVGKQLISMIIECSGHGLGAWAISDRKDSG